MPSLSCNRCSKTISAFTEKGLKEKINKEFVFSEIDSKYYCINCKSEIDNMIRVMKSRTNLNEEIKNMIDYSIKTIMSSNLYKMINPSYLYDDSDKDYEKEQIIEDLYSFVLFITQDGGSIGKQSKNKVKRIFKKNEDDVSYSLSNKSYDNLCGEELPISHNMIQLILCCKAEISNNDPKILLLNKKKYNKDLLIIVDLLYSLHVVCGRFFLEDRSKNMKSRIDKFNSHLKAIENLIKEEKISIEFIEEIEHNEITEDEIVKDTVTEGEMKIDNIINDMKNKDALTIHDAKHMIDLTIDTIKKIDKHKNIIDKKIYDLDEYLEYIKEDLFNFSVFVSEKNGKLSTENLIQISKLFNKNKEDIDSAIYYIINIQKGKPDFIHIKNIIMSYSCIMTTINFNWEFDKKKEYDREFKRLGELYYTTYGVLGRYFLEGVDLNIRAKIYSKIIKEIKRFLEKQEINIDYNDKMFN